MPRGNRKDEIGLVTPNNRTGHALSEGSVHKLVWFCKKYRKKHILDIRVSAFRSARRVSDEVLRPRPTGKMRRSSGRRLRCWCGEVKTRWGRSVVTAISYHSRGEMERAFGVVAGFLAVGSVL